MTSVSTESDSTPNVARVTKAPFGRFELSEPRALAGDDRCVGSGWATVEPGLRHILPHPALNSRCPFRANYVFDRLEEFLL